jgi:hypothetical protein
VTTNSTPYQSGEISFRSINRGIFEGVPFQFTPPVAVVSDRQLWMGTNKMLVDSVVGIKLMALSLYPDPKHPGQLIDIENGDVAVPSNWQEMIVSLPDGSTPRPARVSPALAATSTRLFMIWNEEPIPDFIGSGHPRQLRAAGYWSDDGDSAATWHGPWILQANSGWSSSVPADEQTAVAATAFGEDIILIACGNLGGQGYVGAFHIGNINYTGGVWPAWNGAGFSAVSGPISLAWFNGSTQPSTPTNGVNPPPPFMVWVTGTGLHAVLNLGSDGGLSPTGISWGANGAPTVARDPGGVICVYGASGASVQRTGYNTAKLIQPSSNPVQQVSNLANRTSTSYQAYTPGVAYVKDAWRVYSVQAEGKTGAAYPWYEFIFYYSDDFNVYCQVSRYCTTELFPSFKSYVPVPNLKTNKILTGIIDSPVPIPNVNIANQEFSNKEHIFAKLTYGWNTSGKVAHSVTSSWRFGIKTEGATTAGFGPAWDISIQGGLASVNETSVTNSLEDSKGGKTQLGDDDAAGKHAIDPESQLLGTTVNIDWTVFRYRDPQGNLLIDGTDINFQNVAPMAVLTSVTLTNDEAISFMPYSVTPGEIESYTKEKLNDRMQALGYPNNFYFQEVIDPNAFGFTPDANYLRFAWNNDGGFVDQNFEEIATSFRENSWSLDAHVYGGVSGGGGVAGIESVEFKLMVGFDYSRDTVDSTETETKWSIGLDGGLDLSRTDNLSGNMVQSYGFRLYFLPIPDKDSGLPPNYWVNELIQHLPATSTSVNNPSAADIDPGASAWKILFIVDSYQLADGTSYP